jgi:hypothetical protein
MNDLHPDLLPIAFLIGTWRGDGRGVYPTIEDFTYSEEVTVVNPPGKPFLAYSQKTKRTGNHPEAGRPLHTETGYFRPLGAHQVELVVAMPTGVTEVHAGTVADRTIRLRTVVVGLTPTAKAVTSVERTIEVAGDKLRYDLLMGAVGQDHQLHLRATLSRATG